MERREYLDALTAHAGALATVARAVGPDAAVPATPEWSMAKLVKHTGTTHRWAHAIVQSGEFANPGDLELDLPADEAAYPDWLEQGAAALVTTFQSTDPDTPTWSWGVDQHVRFWCRRMAHETAVHRWDGQTAGGTPDAFAPELAVDGIAERLENLVPSMNFNPEGAQALVGTGETMHLHATDTDGEWLLQFGPEFTYVSEHAKGDVAVRGPVSDLLLYLIGRRGLDGFEVFGDAGVLDAHSGIRSF